ncbi:MAG: hypothetical protein ABWY71_02045, partial [Candidatus Saccharimonadales bacterium]
QFMEMTQPATDEAPQDPRDMALIGNELARIHADKKLFGPPELEPWHDSPRVEASVAAAPVVEAPAVVKTPAPSVWFTPDPERAEKVVAPESSPKPATEEPAWPSSEPARTRKPPLTGQGSAGTHTALRTGGWVEHDTSLPVTPADELATGTVYRSASAPSADYDDIVEYTPDHYANDHYANDAPDVVPGHTDDDAEAWWKWDDDGSDPEVNEDESDLDHWDWNDKEDDKANGDTEDQAEETPSDLETQGDQGSDSKPQKRQRSLRRLLSTGSATLGVWLGLAAAGLAENKRETYERLPAHLRTVLRIADGAGVLAVVVFAKSSIQTVLTVRGVMGPSYGVGDTFRDMVDGLTHHHASLLTLPHHDAPPQGGDTGADTPPPIHNYDADTRTAHTNDPVSHEASNVSDWSEQTLVESLRKAGIPEDEVQRMINDPDTIEQLNQTFFHQNPVVGEDPNQWLNAEDTYKIGDVEKLTDQMAAQRAAELGIPLPDATPPVDADPPGTTNGGEGTAAPNAQEPAPFDQEGYERWLGSQAKGLGLQAIAAGSNAALVVAGTNNGKSAARAARKAGVGKAAPGRIRSTLQRILRRGPRP